MYNINGRKEQRKVTFFRESITQMTSLSTQKSLDGFQVHMCMSALIYLYIILTCFQFKYNKFDQMVCKYLPPVAFVLRSPPSRQRAQNIASATPEDKDIVRQQLLRNMNRSFNQLHGCN